MSDLDPQLAALLRRSPPAPTTLDDAHRQAVLAAARQAWFRQRARSRRNLISLAAAAVFAAAIAGWTIRSLVDAPVQHAPPAMAVAERLAERPAEQATGAPTLAQRRPEAHAPPAPVPWGGEAAGAAPAAAVTPMPTAAAAAAEVPAPTVAAADQAPAAAPAPMAAPIAALAPAMADDAHANGMEREAGPGRRGLRADAAAAAPAAMAKSVAEPAPAPAPVPVPRGRLVMAGLVLEAASAGRLAETDRRPALQAALDSLAGMAGPEAEALRLRLRAALAQR